MTETSAKQRFAESKARAIAIADHKHLLFLEAKKRQAEMVRQKGEGHASEETDTAKEGDHGWAQKLVMKIVDNIQITVESLHVRYEQPTPRGDGAYLRRV